MILVLFLLVYGVLFLSLGLWLATKAVRRRMLPKEFLYIGSLAASLTIYYAIFYIYLLSPRIGGIVVKLVLLVSFGALVDLLVGFRRSYKFFVLIRSFFLIPLLFVSTVMLAYSTVFFSCVSRQPATAHFGELDNRTLCHTSDLPIDNSLDFIFGQYTLKNQEKSQVDTWNMVDRPPLQIAATLPILDQGQSHSQLGKYFCYYIFAIFLELSWVAAFWGALQTLKIAKKFQVLAFVVLCSIGFFYINSVFVWPKMLAASMVFTGIFILLNGNKQSKYRYLPISALLISLGVLSHSAVLFTVIPFAVYHLFRTIKDKKVKLKYFAAALMIGLVMLGPWYLYKDSVMKYDRLSKWFLAGVPSATDKRGTAQTIIASYKKTSIDEWVHSKEENVKTLFTGDYAATPGCSIGLQGLIDKCVSGEWRDITFFSTFFAFEALNLGWLAVGYRLIKKRLDALDKELILLIFGSLAFWVLIMFTGGSTIVHAGSYATMMLIALLLIKSLSEFPNFVIGSIVVIQVLIFYLAWITPYFKLN
jgi:hypothetical protein